MRSSKGFNLVELLIAMIVVSISLFGVAKLQVNGMHGMESAKLTTTSVVSVANLVERLSKQRDEIKVYLDHKAAYTVAGASSASIVPGGASCNSAGADSEEHARLSLDCEIDSWLSATFSTLNLQDSNDICYAVRISYANANFNYSAGMRYAIPQILVAIKWKKVSGSSWDTGGCNATNDTGTIAAPGADSDIGYMSMEYIAP